MLILGASTILSLLETRYWINVAFSVSLVARVRMEFFESDDKARKHKQQNFKRCLIFQRVRKQKNSKNIIEVATSM